jgi:hypothetical protein
MIGLLGANRVFSVIVDVFFASALNGACPWPLLSWVCGDRGELATTVRLSF